MIEMDVRHENVTNIASLISKLGDRVQQRVQRRSWPCFDEHETLRSLHDIGGDRVSFVPEVQINRMNSWSHGISSPRSVGSL